MEVLDGTEEGGWSAQLEFLRGWGEDAYGVGLACLRRAPAQGHKGHIRRLTDIEVKAPWDTYAYRIIYQTFYGMRDVLGPLREGERLVAAGRSGDAGGVGRRRQERRVGTRRCCHSTIPAWPVRADRGRGVSGIYPKASGSTAPELQAAGGRAADPGAAADTADHPGGPRAARRYGPSPSVKFFCATTAATPWTPSLPPLGRSCRACDRSS